MNNNTDRINQYLEQSPQLKELIGALAIDELENIEKMIDQFDHTSKTSKNELTNQ